MSDRPRTHLYAVLSDGVVTNVVVAEAEFAAGRSDYVRVDGLEPRPGPGWKRAGGSWQPAPPPRAAATQIQSVLPPP